MARVIAVANQKGGVAKTTTVHTLAEALEDLGKRVLMVDLDPQACLTYATGTDPDALDSTVHDVFMGRTSLADVIVERDGPDIAPSSIDLSGSEIHLLTKTGREFVLKRALREVRDGYDVVLITPFSYRSRQRHSATEVSDNCWRRFRTSGTTRTRISRCLVASQRCSMRGPASGRRFLQRFRRTTASR
jgi:cellulose biosynthesis protein BcsQ